MIPAWYDELFHPWWLAKWCSAAAPAYSRVTGDAPLCDAAPNPEAFDCDAATPHPECDEMHAAAIAEETAALYRFVGRFTRGDAAVYRGTISAVTTGPKGVDGQLDGTAVANLVLEETPSVLEPGEQHRLTIFVS